MIWKDQATGKYYLIPESAILVSGTLKLTTATGKSRFVNSVGVESFEVSEENARDWLLQQTENVLKKATQSIGASIQEKLHTMREEMEAQMQPQSAKTAENVEEWKSFFENMAEQCGQQDEDIASTTTRGVQTLFTELFNVVADAISADEQRQQQSRNSAKKLEALLSGLGASTEGAIAGLPEKIAELLEKPNSQEQAEKVADKLENLSESIVGNAEIAAGKLRQTAKILRGQIEDTAKGNQP